MGKFRTKLKGRNKGKRWAKGQSASSNPETHKHRDLAKSRFFQENLGPSNLTSDALKKHDATEYLAPSLPNDAQSAKMEEHTDTSICSSYNTIDSFASEWSHCSNMSYNRFLKVFRPDSALHKEMLAVLAAITEVIKENGGSESPTEYYCSLLTALEQVTAEQKNEDQITAILSLLNMGIESVPDAVLRQSFSNVSLKLLHILNEYSTAENNVIIKSIFGILCKFLGVQELAMWTHTNTQQVFNAVLNPFCIHSKPKWRKAAQKTVASVVSANCFSEDSPSNPAASNVAEFCERTLDACIGGNSGEILVASVQAGQTTILHVLGLMKDTICFFPKTHMKKSCEAILRLLTLNYPIVSSCGLQVLHALFSYKQAVMSAKLNAQLISALYEYQPGATDVQPMLAWILVMRQAHIHLADVDVAMCCAALPKLFSCLTQLWLSEKTDVTSAVTHGLEILLCSAVTPACETVQLAEQNSGRLAKCFNIIELGLGYQYNKAWNQVLHVIRVMFEVAGRTCSKLFHSCLKSLAELRDSYKFSYNDELEHALGAAVRFMGPEVVLNIIPLKKENEELNMERSWMIPVLKENVKSATLDYWVRGILPLTNYCRRHSMQLAAANDGIGSHSYELLYIQLWSLLPSFCNKPTDVKQSFKAVAKLLGTAISEHKELRLFVMASLRKLIAAAKESDNPEDVAEIARYDKNYLPILFVFYTKEAVGSDEEGQRLAALDTIKTFLTIANPELTQNLFTHTLDRLESVRDEKESANLFVKESHLDIVRALVPYQNSESVSILYEKCIKTLPETKNNKEQKKAYRLLEEICASNSTGCQEFIKKNKKAIQKLLMKSLNSAAVSSKGARLRCLKYLVKSQPQLDHESTLLRSVIPEAVLCCKDVNEKCRATAFELLNTIGETLQDHNQMQQFVTMLFAGLAGPPHVMSATILALASVLHNFSGSLGKENIQIILENIGILMASPTREVVVSCLSFIKVYCTSLPSAIVAEALPHIVKSLTSMTEDCKRYSRIKVRDILDRLVRKYGCDSITPHVPVTDTIMYKRLRNLRKLNARKKKKRDSEKEQDDSDEEQEFIVKAKSRSVNEILADSDSDFEDMEEARPLKTNKKLVDTWIQEEADSIVDFMDPTVVSKITATKPGQVPLQQTEKTQAKDRGFKTAGDGRLIIEDESDSDIERPKRKGFIAEYDNSDSDEDKVSVAETLPLNGRKRKRNDASSVKSAFSTKSNKSQPPMKYQAGGSGIHRPVAASTASVRSTGGSEYKAKKATGDVKRKGKVDPYAYLPLKRSFLNKRKKLKMAGQYKNIVKAAKSGAKKGRKTGKKNRN